MIKKLIIVFFLFSVILVVGSIPIIENVWYTPLGEIEIDHEIYCQWETWSEKLTLFQYIYWEVLS